MQQRVETDALDWLNYENDPNRDFESRFRPEFLGKVDEASEARLMDRTGIGAAQMGAGTSGAWANLARMHMGDRRREQYGANVANAVRARSAQVRGEAPGLIDRNINTAMGAANAYGNLYQNASQGLNTLRSRPSVWGQIAGSLLGGVAQVASSYAGRPRPRRASLHPS